MPELPEVETIRQQLSSKVKGLRIKQILINKPKLFIGSVKDIIGEKILEIDRRAKMLVIKLSNDKNLLIHLKMSGQIIYSHQNISNKFTHVIFSLSDGAKLFYNDMRQFGWIKIVNSRELKNETEKFGPEPLDKNFSWQTLKNNLLKREKLKIKPTLMDQSVLFSSCLD
ncbi:MAG: hypothetical protein M1338_03300 [Patescibacteria group bacterium]|nr:hypothetical protein [Patescibacteria group bacterium]